MVGELEDLICGNSSMLVTVADARSNEVRSRGEE